MQTILGAGGAIGNELARVLPEYTEEIRLVSRNPQKVNESDEIVRGDLSKREDVLRAVEGSEIAYLTVGLPYDIKIWRKTWPKIMTNAIEACTTHKCKLVFFDNIYMYDGSDLDPITEEHPIDPPSKKGKVRAAINRELWKVVREGRLEALIARCGDFYGPGAAKVSVLSHMVISPLATGKKATWLGDDYRKHSFTYSPDAARATALLGNSPEAFGEVWHLPTAAEPPTGVEWIEAVARELGCQPKYRVMSKFMVRLIGLFVPIMKEMAEMYYQNDRDYIFNSDKFERRFDFKPTSYADGLRHTIATDYPDIQSTG